MRTSPLLLFLTSPTLAQSHTSAPDATDTVTGHVFCADTNQPLRAPPRRLNRPCKSLSTT
jgi:hypothetical protein